MSIAQTSDLPGQQSGRAMLCHDLSADIRDVISALGRLEAEPLPHGARSRIDHVKRAVASLSAQIDRAVAALREGEPSRDDFDMDEARFLRLLEIAGPRAAAELVAQVHLDLRRVHDALNAALHQPTPNWDIVRSQTHVLIALAGALGADALQHLAEALNASAHRRAAREASDLHREMERRLGQLIDYVAGHLSTAALP